MTWRVAFAWNRPWGYWHVVRCWKVADDWASRAVDMDRRTAGRPLLRVLAPSPVQVGVGQGLTPACILSAYLATVPAARKIELASYRRAT